MVHTAIRRRSLAISIAHQKQTVADRAHVGARIRDDAASADVHGRAAALVHVHARRRVQKVLQQVGELVRVDAARRLRAGFATGQEEKERE